MFREKSIISIRLKGRRGRARDKPGISGAIINCVLISESVEADLCFKNLNLGIMCFELRKRYEPLQYCRQVMGTYMETMSQWTAQVGHVRH